MSASWKAEGVLDCKAQLRAEITIRSGVAAMRLAQRKVSIVRGKAFAAASACDTFFEKIGLVGHRSACNEEASRPSIAPEGCHRPLAAFPALKVVRQ
ncbi:hypothetical protein KM031_11420 [Gemmobacter fulvus]|uniref:Uncharacterized protein n=1 Tax=Gemmobacter fulvus TaxID=2840474 RepID=A0A975P6V1_9RHOB|nr:hypothetical protein [Gemmobacter fulvus]MBT9245694.1 hypothetical protein [Gemmobacter fulvus]QWK89456.1 hypothetical protein KM031_11420 [Gemmobacter fulvus]